MSRPTPERRIAAELLESVLDERRPALDERLLQATRDCDAAVLRGVRQRVYGVLRRVTWLRGRLRAGLSRPWRKQPRAVRSALLLGAYELLCLDGVPDRAAVDQAVSLARARGASRQAGFVNAVLRRLARGELPCEEPDRDADPLAWAEQVGSQPAWIVEQKAAVRSADEVADWAAAEGLEPPLHLRGPALPGELPVAPVPGVPGAWAWQGPPGPVDGIPGWADGGLWVQDGAAQAVGAALEPMPGERILDACAAPGGKAFHAASAGAEVLALDRSERRMERLLEARERLGLQLQTQVRDLVERPWSPEEGTFDGVLLDAPCTALGVVRRHPDVRWLRRPQDSEGRARVQRALLNGVAPAVRPGGRLVYAVCTYTAAETTELVEGWLADHPEFVLEPVASVDPDLRDGPFLRTFPDRHDLDAFFAARLRRVQS